MRWSSPPGQGEQVPPGCLLSLPPAHPAFAFFFAPIPPSPFPAGRGETKVILCKGLRPLHPRGWTGRGTGEGGEPRARRGRAPYRAGLGGHPVPGGGVPGWSPANPPFSLLFCPLSPFPAGRGRPKFFFYARGFAPCIPGAGWGAALGKGANHAPGGGRAPYGAGGGGIPVPGGVLAFFAACPPCLRFTFLPLSPQPPSRREGGDQSFFMQGASPLASPGLGGARHWGRGSFFCFAGGYRPRHPCG